MLIYLLIFLIAIKYSISTIKDNTTSTKKLAIFLGLLGIFVGISDMLGGYDRYIYSELFDETADRIRFGKYYSNLLLFYANEIGYVFINYVVAFVTRNRYIFIFIYTILIYTLFFFSIKRHCSNYAFALILFLGLVFFFSFTYLRQILSVAIVWLSIKYIIERKFYKFLLMVLLAASVHNSAIIFIIMYFFPYKTKLKIPTIIIIMVICFIFGISRFSFILYQGYGDMMNANEKASEFLTDISGFRIEYLLESISFLAILLFNYNRIPNDRKSIILFHVAIAFCAILLLFIKSLNGGRISWAFGIGIISTFTYLSTYTKKFNKLSVTLIILCLLLYVRILISWGVMLYPYKTFFTNGTRDGDFIEQKYEYDHHYDSNKFYR